MIAVLPLLGACGGGGDPAEVLGSLWVPTDVAVVDADGDGDADVLTLAQYLGKDGGREGRLIVHLQGATGAFTAAQTAVVGEYPWNFAVGDIDGDGAVDVAVVDVAGSRGVWILLQDPGNRGRFQPPREVASGFGPYGVAIADLDGDSLADLAVADGRNGSRRLVLLLQDAARRGSFRPPVAMAVPGVSTSAVAAGDLNGDGLADLAMTIDLEPSGYRPNVVMGISLQHADGSMGPVDTSAPQTGLNVARMSIADYEGDGLNDVFAYFTPFDTSYRAKLMVLRQGAAPGRFMAPVDTSMRELKGIDDAVFADLDGDDRPDAAVAGFFPLGSPSVVHARVHRFTQSGGGAFAIVTSTDLSITASRLTAGDVDGDGRNEIVVLAGEDKYAVLH